METRRKVELGSQVNSTPIFIGLLKFVIAATPVTGAQIRNFSIKFHPPESGDTALARLACCYCGFQRPERVRALTPINEMVFRADLTGRSGERGEIVPTIIRDKHAQLVRREDLDSVAPSIQMPRHLKPTAGFKADN